MSAGAEIFEKHIASKLSIKSPDYKFSLVEGEIKEYDKYITGDCYGYKIYEVEVCDKGHEHKTELDSCWGYYDEDDCTNEAKGIIEHYQTKLEVC